MLNTAISLGRAGVHVEFISDIANDQPGEMIIRFLEENIIGTTYLNRYSNGKTTLALAFLDKKAEAEYSFYAEPPKELLVGKLPILTRNDIVLFGSFFSLTDGIHEKLKTFLTSAGQNGAMILYDPNFRRPHINDLPRVMPRIMENFAFAGIIRGSHEDFLHIFATQDPLKAYNRIRTRDSQVMICTRGNEDVNIMAGNQRISVPIPKIEPVSTIGAGDSFNAGLIHAFMKMGISSEQIPFLSITEWEMIAGNAIRFSQNVCLNLDNYISKDLIISLGK
jgi:fructokinase